jgi:hypothetical protein
MMMTGSIMTGSTMTEKARLEGWSCEVDVPSYEERSA